MNNLDIALEIIEKIRFYSDFHGLNLLTSENSVRDLVNLLDTF